MATDPVQLALLPLRATWHAGEFALGQAAACVRLVTRLVSPSRDETAKPFVVPKPPHRRTRPAVRDASRRPAPARAARPAPRPTPPGPTVEVPTPAPAPIVEQSADAGMEDGAGAEVHVDQPWEGYSKLKAAEVRQAVAGQDGAAVLGAVRLYEATHRNRRTVLEAVDRRLAELATG